MGTAVQAATVHNTGRETEQPRECTQAQIKVSKRKKMYLVQIGSAWCGRTCEPHGQQMGVEAFS